MILLTEVEMYELVEIVAPYVMDKWKRLAYRMRYTPGEVEAFRRDSQDINQCCIKLFSDWITTDHGPVPKTYQTLLSYIKRIKDFAAASVEIERNLMKGKGYIVVCAKSVMPCIIIIYSIMKNSIKHTYHIHTYIP